jgi:Tfp pilus assembly protein PilZ
MQLTQSVQTEPENLNDVEGRADTRFKVKNSFVRVECKSFEVNGATADVKPDGLMGVLYRFFSPRCDVLNISKGGLAFETSMRTSRGRRVTVTLSVPDRSEPLELRGEVRWVKRIQHTRLYTVGIRFDPFGRQDGCNAPFLLDALRSLERTHADTFL